MTNQTDNMLEISKKKRNVVIAFERGFRVEKDGSVIGIKGKPLKLNKIGGLYPYSFFSMRYKGERIVIPVHILCAYQKYGEAALRCECVRHLDGNSLNNSHENIAIGTLSENKMDIPNEIRKKTATIASHSFIMKWDGNDVIRIKDYYNKCHSYKETMNEFGILSKGSLHYILNHR